MRRLAIAMGLALGVLSASASAEIINLPVFEKLDHEVALQAGTWQITPVKEKETPGANYTAYNVWGFSRGCTDGLNCTNGYRWAYELVDGADNVISSFNTSASALGFGNTESAETAFDIARDAGPFTFTLETAQTLRFIYSDSRYDDNVGGVSLDLSLLQSPPPSGVPTPGTALLLGLGLAALAGGAARRRTPVRA